MADWQRRYEVLQTELGPLVTNAITAALVGTCFGISLTYKPPFDIRNFDPEAPMIADSVRANIELAEKYRVSPAFSFYKSG